LSKYTCFRVLLVATFLLLLGACERLGEDHPITRKLTWFSHVGGSDIRNSCVTGAPDRYRFVYNGIYVEQVRSYDILPTESSAYYRLKIAVAESARINEIVTELARPDIFQPWRPRIDERILSAAMVGNLNSALRTGRFFASGPPDRTVSSIEFYWAVSACLGGQFHFNAYVWPSDRFGNLTFPDLLRSWDQTEISFSPPRKASEYDVYGTYQQEEFRNYFHLRFDGRGLAD